MSKYDFDRKEWMNPDTLEFSNDFEKAMYHKHLVPYHVVKDNLKDLNVLEIGCGAGYGLEVIHDSANKITTVDIDPSSLEYAKANYGFPNITFVHSDITKGLSFEDNTFDYVISFQVIEHFTKKAVHTYLKEIKRLLKPGGSVFFTTPNRDTRLLPSQQPLNHYHPLEYSEASLNSVLTKHFKEVRIEGLRSTEEIEELFNTRKNQSALRAYFIKPVRNIIYSVAQLIGFRAVTNLLDKRSKYSRPKKSISTSAIGIQDFNVLPTDIKHSIDLFAVCIK